MVKSALAETGKIEINKSVEINDFGESFESDIDLLASRHVARLCGQIFP